MSPASSNAVRQPTALQLTSSPSASAVLAIETLRALLPPPLPVAPGMPTGLDGLDRVLASGGLPRGRLTEVIGATGKLTLLRQIVKAAVERGEWVAYIDASRTLAPRDWARLGDAVGVWIVRPRDPTKAAWCADVLLRSAAFSLVVLDSAPPISRAVSVRLTGLARESNAAFVVVGTTGATKLGGAVRLRVSRRRQRLRISVEKGGGSSAGGSAGTGRLQQVVEVGCANGVARCLCTYPEVPDRRGAARATSGRKAGRRAATPAYGGRDRGMLQPC